MRNSLLEAIEKKNKTSKFAMPKVGNTIKVGYIIKEGEKSRTQYFLGTVVSNAKKNSIAANFSVYRAVGSLGTLRKFLLNSPLINSIDIVREGRVKKAKVNHIIGKVGKEAKVKSKT